MAARIDVRVDPDASWIDQYVGLIAAADQAFLSYPGTGLRALTSTGPSAAATRLTDAALQILRRAGFAEEAAVQVFTATYLMFVGWLATRNLAERNTIHPALAAAGAGGLGADGDRPLQAVMRRLLLAEEKEIT